MTNGANEKNSESFPHWCFFWKRHLATVPHWQFSKSQTYGPDKALQMRVGAEKKLWTGRELSTLPLIGRRRKSEASLWEIRQLSPYATQLMAIFNTLITEKSKREIQGDLGNWDSIAAHRLYRWLKDPEKCENHPIILHFFCLQRTAWCVSHQLRQEGSDEASFCLRFFL